MGTAAPDARETNAISSQSVVTMTTSAYLDSNAFWMLHDTSGLPHM